MPDSGYNSKKTKALKKLFETYADNFDWEPEKIQSILNQALQLVTEGADPNVDANSINLISILCCHLQDEPHKLGLYIEQYNIDCNVHPNLKILGHVNNGAALLHQMIQHGMTLYDEIENDAGEKIKKASKFHHYLLMQDYNIDRLFIDLEMQYPDSYEQIKDYLEFEKFAQDTQLIAHKLGIEDDLAIQYNGYEVQQDLSGFDVTVTVPSVDASLNDYSNSNAYKLHKDSMPPDQAKETDNALQVVQECFLNALAPHRNKYDLNQWIRTAREYLDGKPVLYESIWEEHSAMTVLYKDRIYICNKGAGTDHPSIKSYQIGNLSALTEGSREEVAEKIQAMANFERKGINLGGLQDLFPVLGGSANTFDKAEVMWDLELTKIGERIITGQKVGNCSYTNTKRAVDALMQAMEERAECDVSDNPYADNFPDAWKKPQTETLKVDISQVHPDELYQSFTVYDRVREIQRYCRRYLATPEALEQNPSAVKMLMLILRDQSNPNSEKNVEAGKAIIQHLHTLGMSYMQIQKAVHDLPEQKTIFRAATYYQAHYAKKALEQRGRLSTEKELDIKQEKQTARSKEAKFQQMLDFYEKVGIPAESVLGHEFYDSFLSEKEHKKMQKEDQKRIDKVLHENEAYDAKNPPEQRLFDNTLKGRIEKIIDQISANNHTPAQDNLLNELEQEISLVTRVQLIQDYLNANPDKDHPGQSAQNIIAELQSIADFAKRKIVERTNATSELKPPSRQLGGRTDASRALKHPRKHLQRSDAAQAFEDIPTNTDASAASEDIVVDPISASPEDTAVIPPNLDGSSITDSNPSHPESQDSLASSSNVAGLTQQHLQKMSDISAQARNLKAAGVAEQWATYSQVQNLSIADEMKLAALYLNTQYDAKDPVTSFENVEAGHCRGPEHPPVFIMVNALKRLCDLPENQQVLNDLKSIIERNQGKNPSEADQIAFEEKLSQILVNEDFVEAFKPLMRARINGLMKDHGKSQAEAEANTQMFFLSLLSFQVAPKIYTEPTYTRTMQNMLISGEKHAKRSTIGGEHLLTKVFDSVSPKVKPNPIKIFSGFAKQPSRRSRFKSTIKRLLGIQTQEVDASAEENFNWSNPRHIQNLINYNPKNENLLFIMLAEQLYVAEKEGEAQHVKTAQSNLMKFANKMAKAPDMNEPITYENFLPTITQYQTMIESQIPRIDDINAESIPISIAARSLAEAKKMHDVQSPGVKLRESAPSSDSPVSVKATVAQVTTEPAENKINPIRESAPGSRALADEATRQAQVEQKIADLQDNEYGQPLEFDVKAQLTEITKEGLSTARNLMEISLENDTVFTPQDLTFRVSANPVQKRQAYREAMRDIVRQTIDLTKALDHHIGYGTCTPAVVDTYMSRIKELQAMNMSHDDHYGAARKEYPIQDMLVKLEKDCKLLMSPPTAEAEMVIDLDVEIGIENVTKAVNALKGSLQDQDIQQILHLIDQRTDNLKMQVESGEISLTSCELYQQVIRGCSQMLNERPETPEVTQLKEITNMANELAKTMEESLKQSQEQTPSKPSGRTL